MKKNMLGKKKMMAEKLSESAVSGEEMKMAEICKKVKCSLRKKEQRERNMTFQEEKENETNYMRKN